uniref:Glycosyl transferase family 25 domain-containing protein n=1 Tax=viral metagenome TaxID=1070528 RepID=A0A6C0E1Y9_9ZZZZ
MNTKIDKKSIINRIDNYAVNTVDIINTKTPLFINRALDKIFVINLEKDKLRKNYICILMKKYKINFTLITVQKINNQTYQTINKDDNLTMAECGCLMSHLWCLQKIIKENYKNAIIFEDDIILHKNFHRLFKELYRENYNFLILGACDFSFSSINHKEVNNGLYVPNKHSTNVYGAHANYYSLEGAKKMFEIKTRFPSFVDSDYHSMFQWFTDTSFICYPNLVVSDISTSNLSHTYPFFSVYETNYYNKCFINFDFNEYNFIYLDIIGQQNKNVNILDSDTFETYMMKLIYCTFYNKTKELVIKNRIAMNFYTINDIKWMINCTI